MATNYKRKYEELMAKKEVDEKIEIHRKHHIHIPFSWVGRFFAFVGSAVLAFANFLLIMACWDFLQLGSLSKIDYKGLHQLLIVYPIIGEYLLIGLAAICFVAMVKGGFNKLKSFDEEGLMVDLVAGLGAGLVLGSVIGLVAGLLFGLAVGLVSGLVGGLWFGLVSGLGDEFKNGGKNAQIF